MYEMQRVHTHKRERERERRLNTYQCYANVSVKFHWPIEREEVFSRREKRTTSDPEVRPVEWEGCDVH
jgi:hypothetical protein